MPPETVKPLTPQWNQLTLEAIKLTRTSPPLAARALAMVHTAIFDGWSVYNKNAISTTTARYIKRSKKDCDDLEEEMRKTISYAAFSVLNYLFWSALPSRNKSIFRELMIRCTYNPDDCSIDTTTSEGIGNLVGRLIIDSRKGDGANQEGMEYYFSPWGDYTGYKPQNPPQPEKMKDINHWQPLTVNGKIQNFLTPHWSLVKPFALPYAGRFRPKEPFGYPSYEFNTQIKEVLEYNRNLTEEQKAIVEYWLDGPGTYTPSGHWCEITQFVASDGCKNYNETECVQLFFAVTNALLDASISCWDSKRHYDSVRPITAIHKLYYGKKIEGWAGPNLGTQTILGQNWKPYQPLDLVTPAFAEHVSGHSNFSRSAATILSCFTGSDDFNACATFKKGESVIEEGKPLNDVELRWSTFTEAAEQAGLSRLYGGIHFRKGNEDGLKLGEEVGRCVWEKALFYFNNKNQ